ncbi:MAG: TlpA family protein disulfide reductase [Mucilaginibacter sp.]|nr:TlpA family protein disulfide reductase [Mucilaginibacter sp.]
MKNKSFLILINLLLCYSCTKYSTGTKVILNLKAGLNEKVFLEKIAFNDEKQILIDSATVTDNHHPIIFNVPVNEERLYRLRISNSNMRILFINDVKEITINADWFTGKYSVKGTAATQQLADFQSRQLRISDQLKILQEIGDKKKKVNLSDESIKRITDTFNSKLAELNQRPLAFADTVSDPVMFMVLYNSIDFGNDHARLKKFIQNGSSRFPGYRPLQVLKKQVDKFLSLYENQYKTGDTVPWVTLTDKDGKYFSTASLKGKYFIINFWATYCSECYLFNGAMKKLNQRLPPGEIQMVSVAIDDQKDAWKNIIEKENYNWTELIDENMWNGAAVNTLKVDSIPFNFFVSPTGKIIGKNIRTENLANVVLSAISHTPVK